MNRNPHVESVPGKLGGASVFKGTRIPVNTLFDYLEDGQSVDDFLHDFEIDAALVYGFVHSLRLSFASTATQRHR